MNYFILLLCYLLPHAANALGFVSLGGVAGNLLVPFGIASDFIGTIAIIIGSCCLFGAFVRYMQHRVNPMITPISTILTLFIIGLILVGWPFLYHLTESGIPYEIHFS